MKWGSAVLEAAGKQDAAIDAKLLMKYLLGYDDTQLLLKRTSPLELPKAKVYEGLIEQRGSGIPLQHITHEQEFMGLSFYVDENVLVPRQDTETLIEAITQLNEITPFKKGIDIGTGSGCISIALATFMPHLVMHAVDLSPKALEIASKNVKAHQLEDRVVLLESNLFASYASAEKVDLIVSNPPYMSAEEVETLEVEVRTHEPRMALTDEGDGLWFYKTISHEAKAYLEKGGLIAYEIGYNQAKAVTTILEVEGYRDIQCLQDLAGKDRVILARY